MNKPPFRADHVGSLLRPPALLEARQKKRAGEIDDAAFREVQQRCVREVVARQEALGLAVVTDGEFTRDWWHIDFLDALEGVDAVAGDAMVKFQGPEQPLTLKVNGRIRRGAPIFVAISMSCARRMRSPTCDSRACTRTSMMPPTSVASSRCCRSVRPAPNARAGAARTRTRRR